MGIPHWNCQYGALCIPPMGRKALRRYAYQRLLYRYEPIWLDPLGEAQRG